MRNNETIALCYQATMGMSTNREHYHTKYHVESVLDYVREYSLDRPSNELIAAVMYHDSIYDEHDRKEERSAELARIHLKDVDDIDVDRVSELIMYTANHSMEEVGDDSEGKLLIKADLYGLTDPLLTVENFVKINKESQELYNINQYEAAIGSKTFMLAFRRTMFRNYTLTRDPFWIKAHMGCDATIAVANAILTRRD